VEVAGARRLSAGRMVPSAREARHCRAWTGRLPSGARLSQSRAQGDAVCIGPTQGKGRWAGFGAQGSGRFFSISLFIFPFFFSIQF
jgi:hypothetical protein